MMIEQKRRDNENSKVYGENKGKRKTTGTNWPEEREVSFERNERILEKS